MTTPAEDQEMEALLDAIYASIRAPTDWPQIIPRMAVWLKADSAAMLVPRIAGFPSMPVVGYKFDITPVAEAYPRYLGTAPWTTRALATGRAPGVFTFDELMPPEEQAASPYYQDIVVPMGIRSAIFTVITLPGEFGAPPIVLNFFRHEDAPAFGRDEMARVEAMLPHMRRALRLSYAAISDPLVSDELRETMSAIGAPCLALSADGEALFANASAQSVLEKQDGVRFVDRRLKFTDTGVQTEFETGVKKAVMRSLVFQWRPRAVIEVKRASGSPMLALVIPIGDDLPILGVETRPRAIVFLLDSAWRPSASSLEMLRDYFGMTSAEIDIAADLSSGLSPKEIAEKRGVKLPTVQTQIKAALSKTGVSRQSALVALVERLRV